jgi:hypothetical protein
MVTSGIRQASTAEAFARNGGGRCEISIFRIGGRSGPKHESQYQPTGTFTSGRATRNMDRLGIRLEDAMLVVDLGKFYPSDKNPAGWAAATVAL